MISSLVHDNDKHHEKLNYFITLAFVRGTAESACYGAILIPIPCDLGM